MLEVVETLDFIYVFINDFPPLRHEELRDTKGIIRHYGRDDNKEKINYVKYPTKYYTKEYIEAHIEEWYGDCKLCKIGIDIENDKYMISKIIHKVPSIKINNEGLRVGITVGILSIIPFLLLLIKKKIK
ncbi:hypothetical protein LCGC14_1063380 [marine sediment metagenome]|uniref:Uncharacterized protein n=1 Tax=marine sediment metagenome TaxID=412755 RepID=A0A0F9MKJ6_9ZZZZ